LFIKTKALTHQELNSTSTTFRLFNGEVKNALVQRKNNRRSQKRDALGLEGRAIKLVQNKLI